MNHQYKPDKDFFALAAKKAEVTPRTAQQWWDVFFETIVEQMYLTGQSRLPGIGALRTTKQEETVYRQPDENGEDKYYYTPERYLPYIQFQSEFTDDINMRGVTKAYRKRLHRGTLTMRDREREKRMAMMQTTQGQITETKAEIAKSAFADKLKQKADESAAKIEESNGKK